MIKLRRRHLVILSVLALALAAKVTDAAIHWAQSHATPQPRLARGCKGTQEINFNMVPLASLGLKTTLHVIDSAGRLLKFEPGSGTWTLLSDHHFFHDEGPSSGVWVELSADGRWISFGDYADESRIKQFWLHDRRTGADRLAWQRPARGNGDLLFSPDGRLMATFSGYDRDRPGDHSAGVFLIRSDTLARTRVALPANVSFDDATASLHWSADGKELLIAFGASGGEQAKRDFYYAWHIDSQRLEAISGTHDADLHDEDFIRQSEKIALAPELWPQSESAHDKGFPYSDNHIKPVEETLASSSGRWHARLGKPDSEGNYVLEVKDEHGTVKRAFASHFEPCIGIEIVSMPAILGWLDERFLVYEDSTRHFYVFDPVSGSTALLFKDADEVENFMW